MKVFILGGYGKVGKPTAKLLAESEMVTKIAIAGRNLERAEKTAAEIGEKATAVQVDGSDDQQLTSLLAGYDLIVNAAGNIAVNPSIQAAIRNKINYCDPSGISVFKKAIQFSSEAETAGISAIIAAGVTPCISNLMGIYAARQLDEVKQFQVGLVELANEETKSEVTPKLWLEEPKFILNALQDYRPYLNWLFKRLQDHGSEALIKWENSQWVKVDPIKEGIEIPLTKGGHSIAYPYFSGDDTWGMTPIDIAKEKPLEVWFSPFPRPLSTVLREHAMSMLRGEIDPETAVNTFFKMIEEDPNLWLKSQEDFSQISKMWLCASGQKQGRSARAYCWLTASMWNVNGYYLTSVALAAAVRLILRGEIQTAPGVVRAEKAFDPRAFLDELANLLSADLPDGKIIDESFEYLD